MRIQILSRIGTAAMAVGLLIPVIAHAQESNYSQMVARAQADLSAGNASQALATSQRAIALNPAGWQAYVVAGGALQVEQHYDKAIDDFTQALKLAPSVKQAAVRGLLEKCMKAQIAAQSTLAPTSPTPRSQPTSEADVTQAEIVLWKTIQDSSNPNDFRAYLQQYPNGAFAALAREHLAGQASTPPRGPDNNGIKHVNTLIVDAREARNAGNFDKAIALDIQAAQSKPDVGLTWYELGDSYLAAKRYPDAITNYQKALTLLSAEKSPKPDVIAAADNNLGEALVGSGKVNDALVAYEAAAQAAPIQAGMFYANEAIVLFKAGQAGPAAEAADKAIAADPTKPIPYYIKGWGLVHQATIDPSTNKIVLPPGCADAYRKFLDMSPTGPLADDARSILQRAK